MQETSGKVTGFCRNAPEIAGSGSSIPMGIFRIFFGWIPANFLCFRTGNRSEIIGKNSKIFWWEYCFHVLAISSVFLPEPARIFLTWDNEKMEIAKRHLILKKSKI
jgi:hypothetical protein